MDNRQKYKTIRHYHNPGDCHELTFSCYEHRPLLTCDHWRSLFAESLDKGLEKFGLNLSAYVFMPDHVHLLVWPRNPLEAQISSFLKTIKQSSSSKIKGCLATSNVSLLEELTIRERPGKLTFRFWQEGPGFDRNLNNPKAVLASIDYIHRNPVEDHLCERAENWKWSSYQHYAIQSNSPVGSCPKWTPLPADFFDGC